LASIVTACFIAGHAAQAGNPSADAARRRAEIERKSREIKKTVEEHRKSAQEQQRAVREGLNPPDPKSAGPASAAAKRPATSLPNAEALEKTVKLLESRSAARSSERSSPSGMKKNTVEYSPKRGQEFAFRVEMSARDEGVQKQWIGTPYFAGIYSDVRRSFAEMFCIGSLTCRIRSSADRPWTPASVDDIEFPQRWIFGGSGVLGAETTSLFDQPTLPLQMSAIIPLEELIFPELPMFSDSPRNESKQSSTFYLRGGQKNILGDTPTTTLNGEFRRVCRIEEEKSSMPRIVNERSFHCPSQEIGLSLRQVGTIDAREGMIVSVDLDYLLEMGDEVPVKVKVRRLSGEAFAAARAEALQRLPPPAWPADFRRIPADASGFGLRLPRSASDIPVGQRVSVSIDINERSAHGSRDYLAQTIAGAPEGKIRVRLEGSDEELDMKPSNVRPAK
jgi:hypothetical protein